MFFEGDERGPVDPVWPAAAMHVPSGHRSDTPVPIRARRKKVKDPRSPAVGLVSLLLFAFVATFFAWFSAGPAVADARARPARVSRRWPTARSPGSTSDVPSSRPTDASFSATVTLLGPASQHVRVGHEVAGADGLRHGLDGVRGRRQQPLPALGPGRCSSRCCADSASRGRPARSGCRVGGRRVVTLAGQPGRPDCR